MRGLSTALCRVAARQVHAAVPLMVRHMGKAVLPRSRSATSRRLRAARRKRRAALPLLPGGESCYEESSVVFYMSFLSWGENF